MRLNKYISETGLCSRREADARIEAGRVTINGAVATLGMQVNEGDVVCVDGQPVGGEQKHVYIALNKPVGVICTTDREIPGNITDFVNYRERIFPIGRLDKESEGLILLTNNGDIVNEILRVENAHEKEYVVTVDRPVTEMIIERLPATSWHLGIVLFLMGLVLYAPDSLISGTAAVDFGTKDGASTASGLINPSRAGSFPCPFIQS